METGNLALDYREFLDLNVPDLRICQPPDEQEAPDRIIEVDRTLSLGTAIKRAGFNMWDDRIISDRCVFEGVERERCRWKLFNFSVENGSPDFEIVAANKALLTRNWTPAKLEHLLAFGAQAPYSHQMHLILATDTTVVVEEDARDTFAAFTVCDRQADGRLSAFEKAKKAEASIDKYIPLLFGSAPIKMLKLSKMSGKFPSKAFFVLGIQVIG